MKNVHVPSTVPKGKEKEYLKNFETATKGSGRMMMFAGDQKVEHLNDDFVGPNIPAEAANPQHYFEIAKKAHIGVFATQLGLIAKYSDIAPNVPYLIKVNSKTNLIKKQDRDPFSNRWLHVDDIIDFKKKTGLNIVGIGYTIYIGSNYESDMFGQAARIIYKAHNAGLITVIWMYPRGKAIKNEKNIHLLAGGAGVSVCLGSDFTKINYPYERKDKKKAAQDFREVVTAAGRTKIICVGGKKKGEKQFLQTIRDQIDIAGTQGLAVGRNIYQRPLDEAVRMANAISAITMYDKPVKEAYEIFKGKREL